MTEDEARAVAAATMEPFQREGFEIAILDGETMEYDFGWVFFYQSKAFMESGNISLALAGNAPVVVTRKDGKAHITGTALPLEQYLARFEKY